MKYFPNRVISSQASFDLSQKPKSDMWEIVGGPRRSNEQSLPAYPSLQVQLPNSLRQVYFNMRINFCTEVFWQNLNRENTKTSIIYR